MNAFGARKGSSSARNVPRSVAAEPAFEYAEVAFRNADYTAARQLLSLVGARGRAAAGIVALFQARIARIEGESDEWFAAADRAAKDHPDAAGRLEGLALRVLAAKRLGRKDEARSDLVRLKEACAQEPLAALGMPTYYLAYESWLRAAYDEAETILERNLSANASVPETLSLLGWVELKRERYHRAGQLFFQASERQRESGEIDLRLQVKMMHVASVVASELVDLPFGRKLRRLSEDMVWPESLAVDRFNTITCFRFLSLLEGDLSGAWLLSREAAVRAPSPAYVAIGETNLAAVCRILGDASECRLGFERAWEILRRERWGAADAEARMALSNFAAEASSEYPAEARKAMTIHDSLTERPNPDNGLHEDRRIFAFEKMATARVAEAENTEKAVENYEISLANWRKLNFDMRAAIVSLDLARITGDDNYRASIEPVLARAPKAWFAHRRPAAIELLPDITPAEKLVLASLLEGKSARSISKDLDRSVHTINNHTRKIFKAFGVTSRAAVLAHCAALGITPEEVRRTR